MNSDSIASGLEGNEIFINILNDEKGRMVITEGRIAHRKVVGPQVYIKILLNHSIYLSSPKKISRSTLDIPVV